MHIHLLTLIFFKGTCKCIRVYIYIDDNASKREEGFWDTVKGLKKVLMMIGQ